MTRVVRVAAAQLGPIQKTDSRESVVERLIRLMDEARVNKVELVVYPELALTTFFPRWFVDVISEADHWYERSMPSLVVQPLDRKSTRLNSSHSQQSRMPSSA